MYLYRKSEMYCVNYTRLRSIYFPYRNLNSWNNVNFRRKYMTKSIKPALFFLTENIAMHMFSSYILIFLAVKKKASGITGV